MTRPTQSRRPTPRTPRGRPYGIGAAAAVAGLPALVPVLLVATALVTAMADATAGAAGRAAPAQDAPLSKAYRLVATWDGRVGQGAPGSVLDPAGIDVTADAVVLVDRGSDRIQRFTPAGSFVSAWGQSGSGPGDLRDPRDVVVAADGRILVTDHGNGRLVAFGANGAFLEAWTTGLTRPWGVAVSGGRIIVTDRGTREVVVLAGGTVERRWGGLVDPLGVAVGADGRVYVADQGAGEVRIFAADGTSVGSLRTAAPPIDVAVDPGGDVYLQTAGAIVWFPSGSSSSRLALYYAGMQGVGLSTRHGLYASVARMAGNGLPSFHGVVRYPWRPSDGLPSAPAGESSEWPLQAFPPGRLVHPHALHVGPGGRVWVLDDQPRLQSFDREGRPQAPVVPELAHAIAPVDVAELPNGDLVVGELRHLVRVPAGTATAQDLPLGDPGTPFWLTGLALRAGRGRVTVLDSASRLARDYGITRTLQPAGAWPIDGSPGWVMLGDLAAPPAGSGERSYVVDRTHRLLVAFDGSRRVAEWPVDGIPARVAVGPDGHPFVLTANGVVHEMDGSGRRLAAWDAAAFSAGASQIADVAVDSGGRVYTVDSLADVVRVWEHDPGATPVPPDAAGGGCRLRGDKRARPPSVTLGEKVTVELQIGGECPSAAPRADIVLAIDRSGSMNASGKITDTRAAALLFLGAIDLTRDRVGVVTFNGNARLVQPLTGDRAAAESAIRNITAVGGTNIAEALRVSAAELFGAASRDDAQRVIVLLTDGRDHEPYDALGAAAAARERGARIFTIGFGDLDPMVMVLSATSPEHYYFAPDTGALAAIYTEIAQRISASVLARTITIVDRVPADMRYVTGSSVPPAEWDEAARTLTWRLADLPFAGRTVGFQLEPTVLGRRPTNVEASAEYVDGLAAPGRLAFPVPEVEVLNVRPTATATFTPFPTPTPRPSPTPPPPEPVYLPIAVRLHCSDLEVHADVVLVMDTSSSMTQAASPDGPTKLAVAVAAARAFVSMLGLPEDQAGVVRFDDDVDLVQELSRDENAVLAALDRLQAGQGTRIDLGIQRALDELTGPRSAPGSNKVLVLLTDGRATGTTDEEVRGRAAAAKAAGVLVYTIGLGDDLDADLLREIAGRPEYAYLAPTADQLEDIYRGIAYTIECPNLEWP